jgi:hypothetical protein
VDLLEGVDIFIPRAVAVYGSDPVFFPSGLTRLDGDKARSWLTFTDPDSEDDAPARRQRFFLGLIRRFRARNDIFTSPAFAPVLGAAMKTGMSQRAMSRLFGGFAGSGMDRLSVQSVGGTRREVSGQTLLIPYYEGSQIKEFVRHALSSLTRQSEGAEDERIFTVEVLNGTNIAGLAGRTAELLRGFGYDVISIGNADRSDYETTRVIDHSGFQDVAEEFAGVIRCENIRFESPGGDGAPGGMNMNPQSLEYRADITLVIGRDFNGRYVSGG